MQRAQECPSIGECSLVLPCSLIPPRESVSVQVGSLHEVAAVFRSVNKRCRAKYCGKSNLAYDFGKSSRERHHGRPRKREEGRATNCRELSHAQPVASFQIGSAEAG